MAKTNKQKTLATKKHKNFCKKNGKKKKTKLFNKPTQNPLKKNPCRKN